MNAYQTLSGEAITEYTIQKSKFIGYAAPVASAEEALMRLEQIQKENRSASHNCFAYIIGQNKGIIRYSDDGEPSGTAGKPIAEVMLVKDVVDCIVVVTRYFGGILLGAGGLVRAYTHTASIALAEAGICTMHETRKHYATVSYSLWDKTQYALQDLPVIVLDTAYAESVKITFLVKEKDMESVIQKLMKTTDGKVDITSEDKILYHPWTN